MLRFALETAHTGNDDFQNLRPRRTEPAKKILAWFTGYGRFNGKADYAQSQSFKRVMRKGAGNSKSHQEETPDEEPITDLTIGKFLSGLKIRLPISWQPGTLEEQLARYREQQADAKKKKR